MHWGKRLFGNRDNSSSSTSSSSNSSKFQSLVQNSVLRKVIAFFVCTVFAVLVVRSISHQVNGSFLLANGIPIPRTVYSYFKPNGYQGQGGKSLTYSDESECLTVEKEMAKSNQSGKIILNDILMNDKALATVSKRTEDYFGIKEGKLAMEVFSKNVDRFLDSANSYVGKGLVALANGVIKPSFLALLEEEYRFFASNLSQRRVAYKLFKFIENLPIICPYSKAKAEIFQSNIRTGLEAFGGPTEIFVTSDKYVVRFLESQRALNVSDVSREDLTELEKRKIWQSLGENFHLLMGTSSRMWIEQTLTNIFGIHETLNKSSAQHIYNLLIYKLNSTDSSPQKLFSNFGIGMLSMSFPAAGNISMIGGMIEGVKPTFMPDKLFNLKDVEWKSNVKRLGDCTSIKIDSYSNFIKALEIRRSQFKEVGAVATFQETRVPKGELTPLPEIEALFAAALSGRTNERDNQRFQSHMLMEMTRMSVQDGLVMQLHTGLERNYQKEKKGEGAQEREVDIPIAVDFSYGLQSLLNTYGNHPNLTLVLYTHDESTYGRELAPLAVQYDSVKVGSPLWYHENPEGIRLFLDSVMGASGIINLAGYSDNSHHFLQISSRHKIWRKVVSDWVAKLVVEGRIREKEAFELARQLAYTTAKTTYRL